MKIIIDWVCFDCGKKHGNLIPDMAATWHLDLCSVCDKEVAVTSPRKYGMGRVLDVCKCSGNQEKKNHE